MPPNLLLPGETVLFSTRRHWLTLALPVLVLLLGTALLSAQVCPVALSVQLDGRCPLVVALPLLAIALLLLLDWLVTRFVLTTHRLVRLQTPLWWRTTSLRLPAIQGLSLRVGVVGRLFGFGDVVADSAATHGGRLVLDWVPDPAALRDRLAAATEARSGAS